MSTATRFTARVASAGAGTIEVRTGSPIANRAAIGPWEKFDLVPQPNDHAAVAGRAAA